MPRTTSQPIPLLTEGEEAALHARIANDDDGEPTDAELAALRPAAAVLPAGLYEALTKRGRPKAANRKVQVTLRIDPRVLEAFRATGDGWQTRMHRTLEAGARQLHRAKR